MALPNTGTISFSDLNAELGRPAGSAVSLGEVSVRTLLNKPSGQINLAVKSTSYTTSRATTTWYSTHNRTEYYTIVSTSRFTRREVSPGVLQDGWTWYDVSRLTSYSTYLNTNHSTTTAFNTSYYTDR